MPSTGEIIGNYRIVRRIGGGGMGDVYLGEHVHMGRSAAVKVLLPELSTQEQSVARFFDEAKATARLRHPGIIEVLDCGLHSTGAAYIVMEYLVGETLGDYLARTGSLVEHPRAVAAVAGQIANALAAAHESGIIHRDLKPDNLFLCASPESPAAVRVKVLDFGIAKLLGPKTGEARRTQTGSLLGTPLYMSPEQCRDSSQIDFRTDIYSLGCILFEMTAAVPPFVREGFGDLIVAHVSDEPPDLATVAPSVSPVLCRLVGRMLAKSPAERPASMREIAREMEAFLGASVGSFPSLAALPALAAPRITPSMALERTQMLPPDQPPQPRASGGTQSLPDHPEADRQTPQRGARQEARPPREPSAEVRRPKRRRSLLLALTTIALTATLAGGYRQWRLRGGPFGSPERTAEPKDPALSVRADPSDLAAIAPFLRSSGEPAFPDACGTTEPALVKRIAEAARALSPGAGEQQRTRGRAALDGLPDQVPERWLIEARVTMAESPASAERASARAVSQCATSAVAQNLHGNALQILQQVAPAEAAYREAIRLAPDWLAPQFNLGLLRLRSNDARGALEIFVRLARAKPDYPSIHLVLADAHRQLGDREAAVADLEEQVKRQPSDGEGWLQLGRALHASDAPRARAAFCRAAALGQPDAAAPCRR